MGWAGVGGVVEGGWQAEMVPGSGDVSAGPVPPHTHIHIPSESEARMPFK